MRSRLPGRRPDPPVRLRNPPPRRRRRRNRHLHNRSRRRWQRRRRHRPRSAAVNAEQVKIFFEVGSSIPPTDSKEQLEGLVAKARASSDLKLAVAGFHDKTGNPEVNADLAKKRAQAVRNLLVAAGIPEERIVLSPPEETSGGSDDREARRVEVGVAP